MLKTYGDLKTYLNELSESIRDIPDDKELEISCNNYRMYGKLLSLPGQGFINLDTLNEDEDEC